MIQQTELYSRVLYHTTNCSGIVKITYIFFKIVFTLRVFKFQTVNLLQDMLLFLQIIILPQNLFDEFELSSTEVSIEINY